MKFNFIMFACALSSFIQICNADYKTYNSYSYLSKPTGRYGVGFQNFHWINTNICPDPNYNGKNNDDFSQNNKEFCHGIDTCNRNEARINNPSLPVNQKPCSPAQPGELYLIFLFAISLI